MRFGQSLRSVPVERRISLLDELRNIQLHLIFVSTVPGNVPFLCVHSNYITCQLSKMTPGDDVIDDACIAS